MRYLLSKVFLFTLLCSNALDKALPEIQICIYGNVHGKVSEYYYLIKHLYSVLHRERSGSVVECLTQDQGAVGSSKTHLSLISTGCVLHFPKIQLRHFNPFHSEYL